MTKPPAAFPRLALGLLIAAVAVWLAFDGDRLDPAMIEGTIPGLGLWAPLGHIVLFAVATILFVPGAIFGLAGGAIFGPLGGWCSISPGRRWARRPHSSLRATPQRIGSDKRRPAGSIA